MHIHYASISNLFTRERILRTGSSGVSERFRPGVAAILYLNFWLGLAVQGKCRPTVRLHARRNKYGTYSFYSRLSVLLAVISSRYWLRNPLCSSYSSTNFINLVACSLKTMLFWIGACASAPARMCNALLTIVINSLFRLNHLAYCIHCDPASLMEPFRAERINGIATDCQQSERWQSGQKWAS